MNGQVLAIAVVAAVAAAWLLVRGLVRSPARLAVRLAPYTERARGRLGTTVRDRRRAGVVGVGTDGRPPSPTVSARALWSWRRRASWSCGCAAPASATLTAAGYRRRQLAYTVVGLAVGVSLALAAAAVHDRGVGPGRRHRRRRRCDPLRATVDGLIDDRQTRDASRGTHRLSDARRVAAHRRHPGRRAGPPRPSHQRDRARRARRGLRPDPLRRPTRRRPRAAGHTDRRAVRRPPLPPLRRHLERRRGDPASLLALSDSLRASRRDALARTMARRRVAMAFPLVAVIAPILILFIAAALPSIVFGR